MESWTELNRTQVNRTEWSRKLNAIFTPHFLDVSNCFLIWKTHAFQSTCVSLLLSVCYLNATENTHIVYPPKINLDWPNKRKKRAIVYIVLGGRFAPDFL